MSEPTTATDPKKAPPKRKSGLWSDFALTLPVFVVYHLGVVLLPLRNAADFMTRQLAELSDHNVTTSLALTAALATVFVGAFVLLGKGAEFSWDRFGLVALEGVVYAVAMRLVAGYVVGRLPLAAEALSGAGVPDVAAEVTVIVRPALDGTFTAVILSLGAGFYEEVAFRVVLFGVGAWLLDLLLFEKATVVKRGLVAALWAVVAAAVFSGWHHVGELADPFEARVFVFRWVCGLVFTAIYAFRGFAPAVWTHALYDIWVLV